MIDKTCPFCGSSDLKVKPVWKTYRFVACQKCKAGGPVCKTEEEALAAFNRRAGQEDAGQQTEAIACEAVGMLLHLCATVGGIEEAIDTADVDRMYDELCKLGADV